MDPETSAALEQLHKSIQLFESLALGAVHRDNLWRYTDAFMQSLHSILEDDECRNEEKRKYFDTTLEQFTAAMKNLFDNIIGQAELITSDSQFDVIEEVEKFNPYHDSQGRFSSANSYAHFTINTRDPSKQYLADAAIAREKERDAQGLVPGPKIKPPKPSNPTEKPKEQPKEQPKANLPAPEATAAKTNLSGKMLETCQAVEAKTVTRKTEKMTLVNENGDIILEKGGTRGSVYFGDYEASLMGPGVTLTHNHPGEFGGTFSGADVRVLTRNDLRAIRAVGKEGTYSLEKTSRTMGLKASAFNDEYSKLSDQVVQNLTSEKKVWQRKAKKGLVTVEDANRHLAEYRNSECNRMHDWLVQNAAKYTYNYVFEPSGGVGKMYDIEKEDADDTTGEYVLDGELYSGDDWMITGDTDE